MQRSWTRIRKEYKPSCAQVSAPSWMKIVQAHLASLNVCRLSAADFQSNQYEADRKKSGRISSDEIGINQCDCSQ